MMAPIRYLILPFVVTSCLSCYVASQEVEFEELKSQHSRQMVVHFMDGFLCLSKKQHLAMEELLEKNWNKGMQSSSRMLIWVGYDSGDKIFSKLKPADLEDILSLDQIRQFESFRERALGQSEQLSYLRGLSEVDEDPMKAPLERATQLEIQRLQQLLELNEKQLSMLRVAAKGTMKQALAERQKLQEKLGGGNLDALNGSSWVKTAVEGPAFRIQRLSVWNSTLKKLLTKEQYSIFLEERAFKSMISSRVSSHSIALSYFHNKEISLDQYQRFTALIEAGIADAQEAGQFKDHCSMSFDVLYVLMDLDDESIIEAVHPEGWEVVGPILERLRASREREGE